MDRCNQGNKRLWKPAVFILLYIQTIKLYKLFFFKNDALSFCIITPFKKGVIAERRQAS